MQGTRLDRFKRIIKILLPIFVIGLCILFDQLTKLYFRNNYSLGEKRFIIPNFFYFSYTINTGAAWSFLANKSWAQLFFKILTGVSLVLFSLFLFFSLKKGHKWLSYSLSLIIGGTIGNFIDRLAFDGVTDFIGFLFGDSAFPIFNLADSFLVVGLIMLIIYYAFIDSNALFKKRKKKEDVQSDVKKENQQPNKNDCVEQSLTENDGDKKISDN